MKHWNGKQNSRVPSISKFFLSLWMLISPITAYACDCDQQLVMLNRKIKETQQSLDKEDLHNTENVKRHLAAMYAMDQKARKLVMVCDDAITHKTLADLDKCNTDHLKAILTIHGWTSISRFGEEADRQAWLLVQHADHDPDFQRRCLLLLEQLLLRGETDQKNYAYLYDRVAIKTGRKQRYGTQIKIEGDLFTLYPFEGNMDELDQRRAEIGLEPIANYLKTLKKFYRQ